MSRIAKRWQKSADWLHGLSAVYIRLRRQQLLKMPIQDLAAFARRIAFIERREYSQNGEDGMLQAIFGMIGTTNRFAVEFGVEDGLQCNTRYLTKHRGWKALLMDGQENPPESGISRAFITAENINELFRKYDVPGEFDLLSIDIDGNDYWVWKAIDRTYRPRVVVIEYNAHLDPQSRLTIPYDPAFQWDKTDYYGASLGALAALGEEKGYTLIATDPCGVNAFFVRDDLVPGAFDPPSLALCYHPPRFKGQPGRCHPSDEKRREWMSV